MEQGKMKMNLFQCLATMAEQNMGVEAVYRKDGTKRYGIRLGGTTFVSTDHLTREDAIKSGYVVACLKQMSMGMGK